jgi:putative ATP-dependent endonuclease of OLD family
MIYIKELHIKNFKSIEDEKFELNQGLNILVGPNNAGKTNIIDAIDLLLGDVYLPKFEPSTDHFFNGEEDTEIVIEATLQSDNDELKKIIPDANDTLKIRFKYSKSDGGSFEINKGSRWERKQNYPFGYYYDFENKLSFLRVKSLRNIMEIAPIRWKSPLKYLKKIIESKSGEELSEVLHEVNEAAEKLSKIKEVEETINALSKLFKDQMDIRAVEFSPTSIKKSDILNEMKILIDDGYRSEVAQKGLGTQNLIIISLFRVMAKYVREEEKKFIIYGIDEPEIGLHPHSQRQLIFSLKNLSEYSQVIVTTHSDHLLDITQIDNIVRIGKENGRTTQYRLNLTTEEKKLLEIQGRSLEEVFFAKRVLIVEGDTEEGFFPEASKKLSSVMENSVEENYSFDYNSVSVINAHGDNVWPLLKFLIKILKSLNIPFVILLDDDKLEDRNSFLQKLEESNVIRNEERSNLAGLDNDEDLKIALKNYNIFICRPFERMLTKDCRSNTIDKIKKAIIFVKENWGGVIEDTEDVFKLLKGNKRWRIGKAIGQEFDFEDIPREYREIIKKVSKL